MERAGNARGRAATVWSHCGMTMSPDKAFAVIWIGWIVSWVGASFWSAPTERRPAKLDSALYRVAVVAGAVLLTPWASRALAAKRLWDTGIAGAYLLAGVTLAGIVLTWWARIYIGPLWSGSITRKAGHRVVDTGPYAFVRHPIYTGLITAIIASAVAEATWPALVGAILVAVGLWLKARIEERFLTAELGADAYGAYRRRVPMLVPYRRYQRSGIRDQ
jgi:protein-S-isoprenylcysteine O-methyltransferase Ste14